MNEVLWKNIEDYNFDYPISEYGFSVRLAYENYWTINFTEKAILEYKKFMYLAAISGLMVSPSEIVDIVWHQHLIFTQSYNDFCNLLGKRIEHVPSTHNKADFEKFKLAKARTGKEYENIFGEQPPEIWYNTNIYQPLQLAKSKIKVRSFLLAAGLIFLFFTMPAYSLLRTVYEKIDNPYFVFIYTTLVISILTFLELYNKRRLLSLVRNWDKSAFIFNFSPLELIYLDKGSLLPVLHACINKMVEEDKIKVLRSFNLVANKHAICTTAIEFGIKETLETNENTSYPVLLKKLVVKPAFTNVSRSINALKKYFMKSQVFSRLFSFNFISLAFVFILGLVRLITGVIREKPVTFILFILVFFLIVMIINLIRLTEMLTSEIIPAVYKKELIPAMKKTESLEWSYFLYGNAILAETFLPLVALTQRNNSGGSDGIGSSCNSNCGSSCSSGCGGCGGH